MHCKELNVDLLTIPKLQKVRGPKNTKFHGNIVNLKIIETVLSASYAM